MIHARVTNKDSAKVLGYMYHDGEVDSLANAIMAALANDNFEPPADGMLSLVVDAYIMSPVEVAAIGLELMTGILLPPATPTRVGEC